jgi:hypothetical protein
LLSAIHLALALPCDSSLKSDTHFAALEKKVYEELHKAAHLTPIAKKADDSLSKLISVKSPVLLTWLNDRKLMQAQEEAIAKEWRQYYLTNMILKSYPESSTDIREGINETFKRIQTLSFADSFKKLVTDRFAEVKKQSLVAIESSKAPNYKQQLLALEKIQLLWLEQLDNSPYEKAPLDYLEKGIHFDPDLQILKVGIQINRYRTPTSLNRVLASELSQALGNSQLVDQICQ